MVDDSKTGLKLMPGAHSASKLLLESELRKLLLIVYNGPKDFSTYQI